MTVTFLIAAVVAFPTSSRSQNQFLVSGGVGGVNAPGSGDVVNYDVTSSTAVAGEAKDQQIVAGRHSIFEHVASAASYGRVGATSYGEWRELPYPIGAVLGPVTTYGGGAAARSVMTDWFVPGVVGTSKNVTMNLQFTGAGLSAGSYLTAAGGSNASAYVSMSVLFNGNSVAEGTLFVSAFNGAPPTLTATGFFSSILNGQGRTVTFSVPAGVDNTCLLNINTSAAVQGRTGDSFVNYALSDFYDTLTFPTNKPILNFEDGTSTLYSLGGDIVDNHLVSTPSAAPEPAALLLILSSLAPLGVVAARHRRFTGS